MKVRRLELFLTLTIFFLVLLIVNTGLARTELDPEEYPQYYLNKPSTIGTPCVSKAMHDINRLGLSISNQGNFGNGFIAGGAGIDPITGVALRSAMYPYPGAVEYLFAGAFWIGSIVGRDTLVSVGADGWNGNIREMWPPPCNYPYNGDIERLTISDPDDIVNGAYSEQDFIAVYTDTVTDPSYSPIDPNDGRAHQPLNIEIIQRSMGWSYAYAEDFILFDYQIKNIGRRDLEQVYMGIYVDGDVGPVNGASIEAQDDICGFKRAIPTPLENIDPACGFIDTINIAWIADFDGKSNDGETVTCPAGFDYTNVTGTRVVRTPSDSLKYSFNWWISNTTASDDFGPRMAGTSEDPFRDFGGFLGTPEGDRNKYYIMRHEEFDYDQMFSAVDLTAEGWLPPSQNGDDFADGYDTRYLFSFGPFDIAPGEVLRVSLAYVAGEDFLTRCENEEELWNSQFPEEYYNTFNFNDLGLNSVWASWIYDNPNRDTNGNNFFGKFRVCCTDSSQEIIVISEDPPVTETTWVCNEPDTMWYEGDGEPDFEGARPPEPPVFWIDPSINEYNEGELKIRFNGFLSETTKDNFSGEIDFEGYRIYYSLSSDPDNYSLLTSFDIEDYNRYEFDDGSGIWVIREIPFTREDLEALYGEGFNPDNYTADNLFYDENAGEYYYFAPQDWNQSNLEDITAIHKTYLDDPDGNHPPTIPDPDSAALYYPEELTEDGYFKYYEYEYTIGKLLPSQLYYVAVTAFDYGSPTSGLPSLETAIPQNTISEYAQPNNSAVEAQGLNVIVYPNPYRIDANYQNIEGGAFEGRNDPPSLSAERKRAIHFMNLPHKCTIRIYTLDGDLIRQIDHNKAKDSPESMHAVWDLISRNTQAVVSGIYYYSVESEYGNQIGKIVIVL